MNATPTQSSSKRGPGGVPLEPRPSRAGGVVQDLAPGVVLAGRYRVDRHVGRGAIGEVWAGEHLAIGLQVAIKRLPPSARLDRDTALRFEREAWLCGRIRSDTIARVLDLVDDERYGLAIVMEFIEGESLSKVLADGKLSPEEAIELGADIADALCHLHRAHVVHRDIKPGNIILERTHDGRRRAVLVDFGASRMVSAGEEDGGAEDTLTAITRVDMAIGTLEYMAPEQILNARDVTAACDTYALGAILFRAVAGEHVYGDLPQGKLVREKLVTDAPPLRTGRTDGIARRLEVLVKRALRRQASERFASIEIFAAELRSLRDAVRAAAAALDEPTIDELEALPFELVPRREFAEVSSTELLVEETAPAPAPPAPEPRRARRTSPGLIAAAALALVVGVLCLRTAIRTRTAPAPETARSYFLLR